MRKTAFLHIGPPKTGTTTLQEILFQNRLELLGNQIFCPNEVNHISVFHYFSSRHTPLSQHRAILDEFFLAINENFKTYIISSEFFSSFQKNELQHVGEFFDSYNIDLKIVAYIRHPLAISISSKQEMLKKGFSLQELEKKSIGMRYSNLINRLREVFLPEQLIFRKFGDHKNGFDLLEDFCSSLQIRITDNRKAHKNQSLSLEAALILDHINEHQIIAKKRLPNVIKRISQIQGQAFVLSEEEINQLNPIINFELEWLQTNLAVSFDVFRPQGFTADMKEAIINSEKAQKILSGLPQI